MTFPSKHGPARRRLLGLLAAVPVAALTGGCQGLLSRSGPPPLLFVLTPKSTFPANLPKVEWQLLIEVPLAPAAINTARIALQRNMLEIEYYARARWPDLAPIMLQTLIVESFENSQAIRAVGRNSTDLRADFVLKSELRKFQVEYFHGDLPLVHVGLLTRVVAMPRRVIVGFKRFDATIEARQNRLSEIVWAFDEALGKVLKRLVTWTLLTAEAAREAS